MLDSWIIEELKRREQRERSQERPRPALELPVDDRREAPRGDDTRIREEDEDEDDDTPRGVIIIDL